MIKAIGQKMMMILDGEDGSVHRRHIDQVFVQPADQNKEDKEENIIKDTREINDEDNMNMKEPIITETENDDENTLPMTDETKLNVSSPMAQSSPMKLNSTTGSTPIVVQEHDTETSNTPTNRRSTRQRKPPEYLNKFEW